MTKVLVKVGNVYFASRWFSTQHGQLKEGEVTGSDSKLFARRYDCIHMVERDANLLGINLADVEFEKVA